MNELKDDLKTHLENTAWYAHHLIDRAVRAVFRGDTQAPEVVECLDRTGIDPVKEIEKIRHILPDVRLPSRDAEPTPTREEK